MCGRAPNTGGERRVAVTAPQSLGGFPEDADEGGVDLVKRLSRSLGGSMDPRRWGASQRSGAMLRIARQDRFDTEHAGSSALAFARSFACRLSRPVRPQGGDMPFPQGIGLRPQPWAGISRPVGPVGSFPTDSSRGLRGRRAEPRTSRTARTAGTRKCRIGNRSL
jgi:hypothetical protein